MFHNPFGHAPWHRRGFAHGGFGHGHYNNGPHGFGHGYDQSHGPGRHGFAHGRHAWLSPGFFDEGPGSRFPGRHPGGRGGGRGGGRIFGQGDLRLVVLRLIAEAPRHGYELIKAIEDSFGGQYAPSPGAIYPTLTLLEEQDLIAPVTDSPDGKKRYCITAAGQAWLDQNRATVDGVVTRMQMAARAMAGDAPPEQVIQAVHTLKHALALRRGRWTDAEAARVAKLIQSTADAIAGGPAAQPTEGDQA